MSDTKEQNRPDCQSLVSRDPIQVDCYVYDEYLSVDVHAAGVPVVSGMEFYWNEAPYVSPGKCFRELSQHEAVEVCSDILEAWKRLRENRYQNKKKDQ